MHAIIALVMCIGAAVGLPSHTQKIVGGALTTIDNYPTMASLLYSWNGQTYSQACGGAIITNRAILTAAHCPFGDTVVRWRVRLGSTMANSGGVIHNLDLITIHPGFDINSMNNDVAIMHTAARISFNKVIQPASIAGANYYLGDNAVVWATGWGTTSSGGPASEQLRHVQIWTINQAECRKRYATDGVAITDAMLCSGVLDVGGRDQCQGDSGGPLYHNRVIVGVCSFGIGCAVPQFPGVNARISTFSSWIQANA